MFILISSVTSVYCLKHIALVLIKMNTPRIPAIAGKSALMGVKNCFIRLFTA